MSELIVSRENKLKIDHEFKNLIPPLTAEEYAGLEESILQEGCRDALIVWGDTLIDGHNRFEICTRHNIPFEITEMFFPSRDDVIVWIIKNQFGRRNLPTYEHARLALRLKAIFAEKAKENQRIGAEMTNTGCQKSDKAMEAIDTKKELAKIAGVSHDTIAKVEKIEAKAPPEVKEQLRNGEISINQAYNVIKLDEKKESILQAQRDIASQADGTGDAVIYIGNSIGHKLKNKCDLLLTDPPYSTDVEDIDVFVDSWLYQALDNVKDTGFAYVFIGSYPDELRAYLNAKTPDHMQLTQVLVWTYKNTLGQNPKDRYKQNWQACLFYRGINAPALDCPLTNEQWAVQEINAPDGRQGDRYHAWQKPLEIAERFIRHSTKPGATVYDPFACTGTFLIAASKLGRRGLGFEINMDNAKIAEQRGVRLCEKK